MHDGRVIVTELQTGRLVRVQTDGKKEVVAEAGGSANSAAIGPDGMMYVCDDGGLKMVEVEGKFRPAVGLADDYTGGSISMAVESAGNVCVATLMNGGISVISPDGASVEHLPTPDPLTTNICFDGPDRQTAYMTLTSQGKLVALDWPRPGLKLLYTR